MSSEGVGDWPATVNSSMLRSWDLVREEATWLILLTLFDTFWGFCVWKVFSLSVNLSQRFESSLLRRFRFWRPLLAPDAQQLLWPSTSGVSSQFCQNRFCLFFGLRTIGSCFRVFGITSSRRDCVLADGCQELSYWMWQCDMLNISRAWHATHLVFLARWVMGCDVLHSVCTCWYLGSVCPKNFEVFTACPGQQRLTVTRETWKVEQFYEATPEAWKEVTDLPKYPEVPNFRFLDDPNFKFMHSPYSTVLTFLFILNPGV